ncbi:MAG: hypothetical protein J3Q66DRAFT_329117 [Benniella sp.]|nr:MAG: hypothetical protein J3Q66DRAFT_329117 [Benniella sp.]
MKFTTYLTALASVLVLGTVRADELSTCSDNLPKLMKITRMENTPVVAGKWFCVSITGDLPRAIEAERAFTIIGMRVGETSTPSWTKDLTYDNVFPMGPGMTTIKVCAVVPYRTPVGTDVVVHYQGINEDAIFCVRGEFTTQAPKTRLRIQE